MAENSNPQIKKNGVAVGRSFNLNFIEGSGVTMTVSAVSGESTDVTISAAGGPGGGFAVDTGGNVA